MMNILIGNLVITDFCLQNPEHIKFRKELIEDKMVNHFFPNINEENFIKPITNPKQIEPKNSYFIKKHNNLIGWIYIGGCEKELTLDCIVHPNYRGLGYGKEIVKECTNYIFNHNLANEIELMISPYNTSSINCAKKNKYKKIGKIDRFYVYQLSKGDYYDY